jgi:hypothetical protein
MLYAKNLPSFERVFRITVGIGLTLWGMLYLHGASGSLWGLITAGSGLGVVLTGLVGFCPACAMVGRKSDKGARGA